jgi:hypothetical protein
LLCITFLILNKIPIFWKPKNLCGIFHWYIWVAFVRVVKVWTQKYGALPSCISTTRICFIHLNSKLKAKKYTLKRFTANDSLKAWSSGAYMVHLDYTGHKHIQCTWRLKDWSSYCLLVTKHEHCHVNPQILSKNFNAFIQHSLQSPEFLVCWICGPC